MTWKHNWLAFVESSSCKSGACLYIFLPQNHIPMTLLSVNYVKVCVVLSLWIIRRKWHFFEANFPCGGATACSWYANEKMRLSAEQPGSHPRFLPLPSNSSSITMSWNLSLQSSQIRPLLFILLPGWDWSPVLLGKTGRGGKESGINI